MSDWFPPANGDNLLPFDGTLRYHGVAFGEAEIPELFRALREGTEWRSDELRMFGKRIVTSRKVAWYGDPGLSYTYSGSTKEPLPWTELLLTLKARVEEFSGESYNSCLLNLYHDGGEGMSWHSDDEKSIVPDSAIASLSFGAARKFAFKHRKSGEKLSLVLENGSLLVMKDEIQRHWLHSLPKTKRVSEARINLTFRRMRGG